MTLSLAALKTILKSMINLSERIVKAIRDVADFPKKGILFKDITPILEDPLLSADIVAHLAKEYKDSGIDAVAGVESRGFFFGFPLAIAMKLPFIPVRKQGKLPYDTVAYAYELEYGEAVVEMHSDVVKPGMRVLIHDDLLATGGTAMAAAELVKKQGGEVAAFSFVVELEFLKGRDKLKAYNAPVSEMVKY